MVNYYLTPGIESADLENTIRHLTELLYKHYGEKVIVFVDEYDAPLINALQNNEAYYEDLKKFITRFFSRSFKTNNYLKKVMFTGIMDVKGEGIFSGLDDVDIFTLQNNDIFAPYFGFTQGEIEQFLKNNGLYNESRLAEIREFYNGYYCLGGRDTTSRNEILSLRVTSIFYNIFSLAQYVSNGGLLQSYWIKSSSSQKLLINLLKRMHNTTIHYELLELMGQYPRQYLCGPQFDPDKHDDSLERGIYFYRDCDRHLCVFIKSTAIISDHFVLPDDLTTGDQCLSLAWPSVGNIVPRQPSQQFSKAFIDRVFEESAVYWGGGYQYSTILTKLSLTNLDFLEKDHINTSEDIYCLLFYAGYLTLTGKFEEVEQQWYFELKIPNREVKGMFERELASLLTDALEQLPNQSYPIQSDPHAFYSIDKANQLQINQPELGEHRDEVNEYLEKLTVSFAMLGLKKVERNSKGNIVQVFFEEVDEKALEFFTQKLDEKIKSVLESFHKIQLSRKPPIDLSAYQRHKDEQPTFYSQRQQDVPSLMDKDTQSTSNNFGAK